MNRVQAIWMSRSRREQIMLAGLGLLLIAIIGWYGVLQPLKRWQSDTAFDRQAAEARQLRMTRQIEDGRTYNPEGQSGRQALEQAARQADVQVRITSQGDDLVFDLDRVSSAKGRAFLVYLDQQRASPKTLRIEAQNDGTLQIGGRIG